MSTRRMLTVGLVAMAVTAGVSYNIQQAGPIDIRCGDGPHRDADGRIIRSEKVLEDFAKLHACPSTGEKNRICPGWAIDHVIPLACGGVDQIHNLQWLPDGIKNSAVTYDLTTSSGKVIDLLPKDRWERKINYCPNAKPAPSCTLQLPLSLPSR